MPRIGTELFPSVDSGSFEIRLKTIPGTRLEETEKLVARIEGIEQGQGLVAATLVPSDALDLLVGGGRLQNNEDEEDLVGAGDIVAIMGISCASGDTYAAESKCCTLESIFVPEPVIKVAVTPVQRADGDRLSKALQRFRKEDPTFRVMTDEETNETTTSGPRHVGDGCCGMWWRHKSRSDAGAIRVRR